MPLKGLNFVKTSVTFRIICATDPFLQNMTKATFIRRISAVSHAIQTIDNEANHLIIYCLNCIRHGKNATYEPGLRSFASFDSPSIFLTINHCRPCSIVWDTFIEISIVYHTLYL